MMASRLDGRSPIAALVLLLTLAGAAAWGQWPASVLPNGDLEDGLTGWQAQVSDPQGVGVKAEVDETQAYHGTKSLRMSVPGQGGVSVTTDLAPVEAGKDYLYSFWFRSEGFSDTGLFAGVNLQYALTWLDAEKKALGNVSVGLAYGAVPKWSLRCRVFTAPAGAKWARISYGMGVDEKGKASKTWLDRLQLRLCEGEVKPEGKRWVFNVADGFFDQTQYRRAADDDTATGFAVIANTRFGVKPSYLCGGMYQRGIPPGQYRVTYRVKVAEIPAEAKPLLSWDVNTDSIGHAAAGTISTAQFQRAGVYQDFSFRVVVPPGVLWVDTRVHWAGGVTTWVDAVTVAEERIFTEAELKALNE